MEFLDAKTSCELAHIFSFGELIFPPRVKEIHTWLHTVGIGCPDQYDFTQKYVNKLRGEGLPIDRFYCGETVLHPLLAAKSWKWMDGTVTDMCWTKVEEEEFNANDWTGQGRN